MAEQPNTMRRATAMIGQFLLYAVFAGAIALFSRWPIYRQLDADQALIKLSIVHEGQRLQACVQRTPEELARLAPNMRAPANCPRERAPLVVEADIDGKLAFHQVAQASGLAHDGHAALYYRLVTSAGSHHIAVRLRDRAGGEGFNYQGESTVLLRPAQILVIDFQPELSEITFR